MAHTTYDLIKKHNGEHFARALRDANLLELPDIVELVRYAGRDADPQLIEYIRAQQETNDNDTTPAGDPFELLHRAGYSFVEYADTLEKQNAIQKYFARDEELCTFHDPNRYKEYYIINAVHQDIDKIKRAEKPERQDAYGTSVISIQMRKSGGFISIKNRYNHSVANPDNIIAGLSHALKNYFDVNFNASMVGLPEGIIRMGEHIIKYNYELNNIYIGDFFWESKESNSKIHEIDKSTQMMMDYFYFDIKKNKVIPIVPSLPLVKDCFADVINTEIAGRRVTVCGKYPNQSLWVGDEYLVELKGPHIKSVNLPHTRMIGNYFLRDAHFLESFSAPNLVTLGDKFLMRAKTVHELNVPRLKQAGDDFLMHTASLVDVNLPRLKTAGADFMILSSGIKTFTAPRLTTVGTGFLDSDMNSITTLTLPRLTTTDNNFLSHNLTLEFLDVPALERVEHACLYLNKNLKYLNAPKLNTVGSLFLYENTQMTELYLPSLKTAGPEFILSPRCGLRVLVAPQLNVLPQKFLGDINHDNPNLKHLILGAHAHLDPNIKTPTHVARFLIARDMVTRMNRFMRLPSDMNTQMVMPITPGKPHTR